MRDDGKPFFLVNDQCVSTPPLKIRFTIKKTEGESAISPVTPLSGPIYP